MSTYVTTEHFSANSGEEVYDTWYGTEVQYAPGYNPLTSVVIGGSYELSGPGAGDVEVVTGLGETGVHGGPLEPNWPYGDYGYHVHVRQAAGGDSFDLEVTLLYVI
jgi:hypothetical protein